MVVCNSVLFHLTETGKLKKKETAKQPTVMKNWRPPEDGKYKLNIDGSFLPSSGRGGWGYVASDHAGVFLDGGAGNISRALSPIHAEAIVALQGLERASSSGMNRIILETDAANLAVAITSAELDGSPEGALYKKIREFVAGNFFLVMWLCVHGFVTR